MMVCGGEWCDGESWWNGVSFGEWWCLLGNFLDFFVEMLVLVGGMLVFLEITF